MTKARRSLLSAATSNDNMFALTKSNSFSSLRGNQSTRNQSKLLPSLQFSQSSEGQNSLLDVSLSPKKPTFNISLQQIQSPVSSEKKTINFGNDFQATLGEINVMKLIEKQNATIAKLTQRIQDQEVKEKKLTKLLQEKDVEPATSLNMDPLSESDNAIKIHENEPSYTLKEVPQIVEEEDEDIPVIIPANFAKAHKRKSILKISTRGADSGRRDSSRSSRVTFAEEEPGSAKSFKSIKDDFNEEPVPQKSLFICKSASACNLNNDESGKGFSNRARDKKFLIPRRSLFEPNSSLESTRRNSDDLSETNSEDNSLASPQRERRSIKRVGRVTLPGRSKLGKILTTKISQEFDNTTLQGQNVRQKLNGVLWTMVFPNLFSANRN